MGATCQICNKPVCLQTSDGQRRRCLHCAIGNFYDSPWTVITPRLPLPPGQQPASLLMQMEEELKFLEAVRDHLRTYIEKFVSEDLKPYKEFLAKYTSRRPNDPFFEYMEGLNACFASHKERIRSQLASVLHTYDLAHDSLLKAKNNNLSEGIYKILRPLKPYRTFPLDASAPLAPILEQHNLTRQLQTLAIMQMTSVEEVRKQFSDRRPDTADFHFLEQFCGLATWRYQMLRYRTVYCPRLGSKFFAIDRSALVGKILYVLSGTATCILYTNVEPLVLIEKARLRFQAVSSVIAAVSPDTIYALFGQNNCVLRYSRSRNLWINAPALEPNVASKLRAACCFNQRYIYAFSYEIQIRRLDASEEECGWKAVTIAGIIGFANVVQSADAELMFLGVSNYPTRKFSMFTSRWKKVNCGPFSLNMDVGMKKGKMYASIQQDLVVVSLLTSRVSKTISVPPGQPHGHIVRCDDY